MRRSRFVAALLLTAAVSCDNASKSAPPTAKPAPVFQVPVEGAAIKGSADALVTLVEFTDFQCPFCGRANATLDALTKEYGSRVRIAVRQTPLGMHPHARHAALAALAAGTLGQYWGMHELLFRHQAALDDASIDGYARELGLSESAFHDALASPAVQQSLARDEALATALGINSTPTFFINGHKLSGAQPAEAFRRALDVELASAQARAKEEAGCAGTHEDASDLGADVKAIEIPPYAPARGPTTAKVTIVEWSDFQCPFCASGAQTLRELERQYGPEVRVVFRHQPLPMHAHALMAASAAMAAQEQGKFWEFHDLLFAHQDALDLPALEKYAAQVGLDVPRFRAALDSGRFADAVAADAAAGSRLGITGTPTFFVNGHQLTGARPIAVFKTIIDEELKKGG